MTLEMAAVAGLLIATIAIWRVAAATRARDERGKSDDSFMKKVVKVSLLVLVVAGGTVWLIDRADDNPPNSGTGEHPPKHHRGHGANNH